MGSDYVLWVAPLGFLDKLGLRGEKKQVVKDDFKVLGLSNGKDCVAMS